MKNFNLFITILSTSFLPVIFSTWDTCSTWTWRPNMNTLGGELGHAGTCNGRYCPVCSNTYGTNNVTTAYGTGNHCISPSKTREKTKCYYYDTNTKACIDGQRHKYTCQGFEKTMKCDSTACDYN